MMILARIYKRLNLLSIDVCLGAVAGGIMAWHVLEVKPPWAYWVILPLSVWLVYTADHIIDGLKPHVSLSHQRHIFHLNNRKKLVIAAIPTGIATAFLAFTYLPLPVILYGCLLGTAVLLYLFLIMKIPRRAPGVLQKELIIALLYVAGIWGPLVVMRSSPGAYDWLVMTVFLLLALADLLLLSIIEFKADQEAGQHSFPGSFGPQRAMALFKTVSIIALSGAAFIILTGPGSQYHKAAIILGAMDISLILISNLPGSSRYKDLYRYLSELVFILPAIMLI
ncbi:MAG TPA: hypothetical protein VK994_05600 [Bacteroidales bacterium]|nr:hypothetical protein [Bacteroidales bacterium]